MVVHAIACVTGLGENGVFFCMHIMGVGWGWLKTFICLGSPMWLFQHALMLITLVLLLELPTRPWYCALNLPGTSNTLLMLRRYALDLIFELPTLSWYYALNLLLENPTNSDMLCLNFQDMHEDAMVRSSKLWLRPLRPQINAGIVIVEMGICGVGFANGNGFAATGTTFGKWCLRSCAAQTATKHVTRSRAKTSRRVGNWTHVLSVLGVHMLDIGCETHGFSKHFSSWYSPCHCVLAFSWVLQCFLHSWASKISVIFLQFSWNMQVLAHFCARFFLSPRAVIQTGQSHSRLWQSFETSWFQCSPISIARTCNAWSKPGYKCGLSSKLETWEQLASTNAMRYRWCPCAHLVHHCAFFFEAQTDSASGYTESVELSTHALAWRSIGHHLYTAPFWHCFHPI